jgi:hypothetical protein
MSINKKQMVWLVVITAVLLTFSLALPPAGNCCRAAWSVAGAAWSARAMVALRSAIGQPVVGAVQNGATLCSGFLCGADAPPINDPDFYIYLPVTIR